MLNFLYFENSFQKIFLCISIFLLNSRSRSRFFQAPKKILLFRSHNLKYFHFYAAVDSADDFTQMYKTSTRNNLKKMQNFRPTLIFFHSAYPEHFFDDAIPRNQNRGILVVSLKFDYEAIFRKNVPYIGADKYNKKNSTKMT